MKIKKKIHKIQKTFNLLDFVKQKPTQRKKLAITKNLNKTVTIIKLNRGKKREIPKKKYSRLRKIILKGRALKKQQRNENVKTTASDISDTKDENYVALGANDSDVVSSSLTKNSSKNEQFTLDNDIEHKLSSELNRLQVSNCHENDSNTNATGTLKPQTIHSRRFQSYCDNLTKSKELNNLTENLLNDLFRFQKRAYDKNQIKARAHNRYVVGFKEVKRQLEIHKTKLIIFAPDCEYCDLPGGIFDIINEMKLKCKEADIPYIFILNRKKLGYILYKKVPVSCIGILNYDGAQDTFNLLIKHLQEEKKNYENLMASN